MTSSQSLHRARQKKADPSRPRHQQRQHLPRSPLRSRLQQRAIPHRRWTSITPTALKREQREPLPSSKAIRAIGWQWTGTRTVSPANRASPPSCPMRPGIERFQLSHCTSASSHCPADGGGKKNQPHQVNATNLFRTKHFAIMPTSPSLNPTR